MDNTLDEKSSALIHEHGGKEIFDDLTAGSRGLVPEELAPYVAQRLVHTSYIPRPLSTLQLSRIHTGVSSIDNALHGGLPTAGALVEIHGASSTGKTQLCLHLAALNGCGTVYAVTSGRFPAARFEQIAGEDALRRTYIESVRDVQALEHWSLHRLPHLLRTTRARIVIIDSIAALYRPAFERGTEIERAKSLTTVAAALKAAVTEVDGVVIAVNQVSARPGRTTTVPALGPAWARCCNLHIELSRRPRHSTRRFRLLHSSFAPECTAYFNIVESGIESANEDEY